MGRDVRRAIGPIVTTGVAIVVAGVVVANPVVVAPHTDVRIPAVKLSGSSDATGSMLDQAFLDAIAPGPAASTNPFSVLKQLITSLAADATSLGKNAIVNAFVAGVTAVSEPELTASALPYGSDGLFGPAAVAPPPDFAGIAAAAQAAGIDPAAVANGVLNGVAGISAAVDPTHVSNALGSAVDQVASSVATDVGYVGHELIAAAYAAGAAVAAEPAMIVATLQSLVKGDIKGALQTAIAAATAPLRPTGMIVNAFVTVVQSHLSELTTGVPTIAIPNPLQAANPLAALAEADSATAGTGDRGVRATDVVATDSTTAPEPVVSDTPVATTTANPVALADIAPVVRGLAGLGVQVRTPAAAASDAAGTDAVDASSAPVAPRAVARDAVKQSRDGARGAGGRGVRGPAPAN